MTLLLDQINSPEDLKQLSRAQLPQLAEEIRQFLLEALAKTGGHLGANLGVVELSIALHYAFSSPTDLLVWDVSHQVYTHKILTGRKGQFDTLRQLDGLSGFAKRAESAHDAFDAGHGGTSMSAALGMARARALTNQEGRIIAVIGDGALTSGMALEALNDTGHSKTNLLVVLNDNAMAISPNVGAMARYLGRIRSEPHYLSAKNTFQAVMRRLPGGNACIRMIEQLKKSVKQMFIPGMLFEDLGFTYLGPVDGHDIPALLDALRQVRHLTGPVLLHVLTTKGKGYTPAETHCSRLHGVSAFDIESGEPLEVTCEETYTATFGRTMCQLAESDERVVAISAAMCDGTGLTDFRESYPQRFFDVGMAEEHAVTLAAGMACEGLRPVVAVYSTFLQRAYDQILHDVCLQNLSVTFVLDRAGLVGEDGPTHHGTFDLSYLRMIPNMTVMAPATLAELEAMLKAAMRLNGPVAIRYPKGKTTLTTGGELAGITAGRAAVLREGRDVALVSIGSMLNATLAAADLLERQGVAATVINARFLKPLDTRTLLDVARRVRLLVTIEENTLIGGFGEAVQQLVTCEHITTPFLPLGLPDAFVGQGPRAILLARLGLNAEGIARAVTDHPATGIYRDHIELPTVETVRKVERTGT
ncbi:MAG: 1-deoxy-D-xylulose-5-phosphate synthase [Armatimonadota bacterium]